MSTILTFPTIPSGIFGSYISFSGKASAAIKTGQFIISDPVNPGQYKPAPANGAFGGLVPAGVCLSDAEATESFAIMSSGIAYVGNADDSDAIPAGTVVKIGGYPGAVTAALGGDTVVGIVLGDPILANGYGRVKLQLVAQANNVTSDAPSRVTLSLKAAPNQAVSIFKVLRATGEIKFEIDEKGNAYYYYDNGLLRSIVGMDNHDIRGSHEELTDATPSNPIISNGRYNGPGNSMCRAPNGDLLYFCREGTTHVSAGDYAVMKLYRSRDQGLTWGTPTTIMSVASRDVRGYGAGTTPTGRIIVFFTVYNCDTATWQENRYFYSDDNGYSWSSQYTMAKVALNGHTPNHDCATYDTIKAIADGKIGFTYDGADGTYAQVRFAWSDDDGLTWNHVLIGENAEVGDWWSEPSFAYLGGGQLVCMCRMEGAAGIHMFTSSDNGLTWSNIGDTTLGGVITGVACMPRLFTTIEPRTKSRWVAMLVSRNITGGGQMWMARGKGLMTLGLAAWELASKQLLQPGHGVGNEYATAVFDGNKGVVLTDEQITSSDERISAYIVHPFANWAVFPAPFSSGNYIGIEGTSGTPTTAYTYAVNYPILIVSTGGTNVVIEITDPINGTTVASIADEIPVPMFLLPSYNIKWTYTTPPTVIVTPAHSGYTE